MLEYHFFKIGETVQWASGGIRNMFMDPITASQFSTMEFVGGGPFEIISIEKTEPSICACETGSQNFDYMDHDENCPMFDNESGHPQIVVIKTPQRRKEAFRMVVSKTWNFSASQGPIVEERS